MSTPLVFTVDKAGRRFLSAVGHSAVLLAGLPTASGVLKWHYSADRTRRFRLSLVAQVTPTPTLSMRRPMNPMQIRTDSSMRNDGSTCGYLFTAKRFRHVSPGLVVQPFCRPSHTQHDDTGSCRGRNHPGIVSASATDQPNRTVFARPPRGPPGTQGSVNVRYGSH